MADENILRRSIVPREMLGKYLSVNMKVLLSPYPCVNSFIAIVV